MSRDYEHEKWVPWYVADTATWLELSLGARGAMAEIVRKLNSEGKLTLRRGLPSLASLLRLRWEGELESAVAELIACGKVEWNGSLFCLSDPGFESRKRRTSADRMRDLRSRKKATGNSESDGGDVTFVTPVTVTPVTPVLVCSSLVLGSGSEIASVPEWWPGVLETIEANTGTKLPSGEAWMRYAGHRSGKGLPPGAADAQYWLSTVMVREARQDRQREQELRAARERRLDPPKPPQPTREQSERFAQELVARVQASKAKRAAGGGT